LRLAEYLAAQNSVRPEWAWRQKVFSIGRYYYVMARKNEILGRVGGDILRIIVPQMEAAYGPGARHRVRDQFPEVFANSNVLRENWEAIMNWRLLWRDIRGFLRLMLIPMFITTALFGMLFLGMLDQRYRGCHWKVGCGTPIAAYATGVTDVILLGIIGGILFGIAAGVVYAVRRYRLPKSAK